MNRISYIEDKNLLAHAYVNRDYSVINKKIDEEEFEYMHQIDNLKIGYKIIKIKQLTDIYKFDVYAISFIYQDLINEFDFEFNDKIGEMIEKLRADIEKIDGYIIFKIPSNNTMIINQLNRLNFNFIFAGGTVCYLNNKKKINNGNKNEELVIRIATESDKIKFKDQIVKLGASVFENYFGQYHISHITRDKADKIYENWINDAFDSELTNNLEIGIMDGKVVAFNVIYETNNTLEAVLGGVSNQYKGKHIYESMINYLAEISLLKDKTFTISTQFDNFIVQKAWVNLGLIPYYSFYLYHLDRRKIR